MFLCIHSNSQVNVNAGPDFSICNNDTLNLADLNASISGLVNNGYWFSSGSGQFLPLQQYNRFSITTKYIPSAADISNGFVTLTLVSDDPDGFGPLPQVSDQVKISFLGAISIICTSNLNVSLGPECSQKITPQMLVNNILPPTNYYTIKLKNQNKIIPNETLTFEHIGKTIEYVVGHKCGSNTCWGYINVQDKLAPEIKCTNKTILCGKSTSADSIGLPIKPTAKFKKINSNLYRVIGIDACGPAMLSFSDVKTNLDCKDTLLYRITRTWTAVDSFGNTSSCVQLITVRAKTINQVKLPPNYDGVTKNALECNGIFPRLANGHPSPDTTGYPDTDGCTNLERTYLDKVINQCGNTYNLIRKWTIINWCGSIIIEHNQLIKVQDSSPPKFKCPKDQTINTGYFECFNSFDILNPPDSIMDCSPTSLRVLIKEKGSNNDYTQLINYNSEGKAVISNLPIGVYNAFHIVRDVCGNADTCESTLTVVDKSVPIPVCRQFIKISLLQNGTGRIFATSLDDGSFDNCGIASYAIRKMTDECGNPNSDFKEFVDFCCAEAGKSIMTLMRVTDHFGNSNTCMVEVKVEDKIIPKVICPSNITISCKNDIDLNNLSKYGIVVRGQNNVTNIIINDEYNSGVAGLNGYYDDNCSANVSSTFTENLKCNQGIIVRTFIVKDNGDNEGRCTQTITVRDPRPFGLADITWPNELVLLNGCNETQATRDKTGEPKFKNTNCATVASTYEDKIFYDTDGACVKILREWTVIDWCQFNSNNLTGKWTRNQTIKINNGTPPVFTQTCRDTIFCLYSSQCAKERFTYIPQASDDCTPDEKLLGFWKIDYDNNGTIDTIGYTRLISAWLNPGIHKVFYTVIDDCDNETSCTFLITARDCKKPTPYCHSEITTVIMPSSGSIEVKANIFNRESFDNCTSKSKLKFSFTEFIKDSTKIFKCTDLVNGTNTQFNISMWVIDEQGNKDFCNTILNINDPNDACPDLNNKVSVSGNIFAPDLTKTISDVNIQIKSNSELRITKSNNKGQYFESQIPAGGNIVIRPSKRDSVSKGLSTLDLILIQRHILRVNPFNDPIKVIAADLDNNQKVNSSDLVHLRKIILGTSVSLPKNRNEMVFLNVNHQFPNPDAPWPYSDSILITKSIKGEYKDKDFIGIKIGDVNHSSFFNEKKVEPRNVSHFTYEVKNDRVKFYSSKQTIKGFQLKLRLQEEVNISVNQKHSNNLFYDFSDGILTIVFTPKENTLPNEYLFELDKEVDFEIDKEFSEFYDNDLQIFKIHLAENKNIVKQELKSYYYHQTLIIESDSKKELEIIISSVDGRVIKQSNIIIEQGRNEIPVQNLPKPALYLISIIEEKIVKDKLKIVF